MDKNKVQIIGIVENAAVELKGYIDLASAYADTHEDNRQVQNISLILDKMKEHIDTLYDLFENNKLEILS